jgi:hypothetical protein
MPKNTKPNKKLKEAFESYYTMILSVIHGVVLATAATALVELIQKYPAIGWLEVLRWLIAITLTFIIAWRYISGATRLEWVLDLFDIVIPSLFGVALSTSFLLINSSEGWTFAICLTALCGIFAVLNILYKSKKFNPGSRKKYLYADRKFAYPNLALNAAVVVIVPVLWFFLGGTVASDVTIGIFAIVTIIMVISDFRLRRGKSIL